MQVKPTSLIDVKWGRVKQYYEHAYRVTFKKRPSDEKIEYLHKQMLQLSNDLDVHFQRKSRLFEKIFNKT